MSLLDPAAEKPPLQIRRYVIVLIAVIATYAAFAAVFPGFLWYPIVYHSELNAVHKFMNAVAAGDMQRAYGLWSPSPSYTQKDFLSDWGPDGYYGPVKSFNVKDTYHPPKGSSGLVVIVEVSPYPTFPEKDDMVKQSKTKEVRLWVEFKDRSIQFPPPQFASLGGDASFVDQHHRDVISNGENATAGGALQSLLIGCRLDRSFAERTNEHFEQFL